MTTTATLAPTSSRSRSDAGVQWPDTEAEFARIVDELTRRGFLAGGLSAAALAGLAACGSSGHPTGGPSSAASTRVVDTAHGNVTIPVRPSRIASVDGYVDETLWDLGVTNQVGCAYTVGGSPRYTKQYAALPKTSNSTGPDLEAVAKLHPDVIVTLQYPYIDAVYDKLTAIAPTVVLPFKTWDVNATAVANIAGYTGQLTGLKQRYATRVAAVRSAHADLLARYRFDVLHGGVDDGKFWLIGQTSVITPLLTAAGIHYAKGTADTAAGYQAVSYENIDVLADANAIIYWSEYGSTTPAQHGPQLFAQKLWQELPAVTAGRLVPIADFAVGGYGDALAALDELDTALTKLEQQS